MRFLSRLGLFLAVTINASEPNHNVIARGNYANSRLQFEKNKTGRVAFMGGSITQMNGYGPMVSAGLRERYPKTKFEFISAGISSTCSTTGAFRLRSEVLAKGRVDLFHRHSRGLHYPRTAMFAANLKAGEHTARIHLRKIQPRQQRHHGADFAVHGELDVLPFGKTRISRGVS